MFSRLKGWVIFPNRKNEYPQIQVRLLADALIDSISIRIPRKGKQLAIAELFAISKGEKRPQPAMLHLEETMKLSSPDPNRPVSLATDTHTNGHPTMQSVAATTVSDNPWLSLKLDQPRPVQTLQIFTAIDGYDALVEAGVIECFDAEGNLLLQKRL